MSQQLESMRNDAKVTLKPLARNELFKKRVEKGEQLGPIQDTQSSVEGPSTPTSPEPGSSASTVEEFSEPSQGAPSSATGGAGDRESGMSLPELEQSRSSMDTSTSRAD